jgi:two-component system nitrate/nitrite response regulator NarL
VRQHIPTILVDQNTLFREGLERLLAGSSFRPVARGAAITDVAEALAAETRPLLFMIGSEQSPEATVLGVHWVKENHPGARVVVLADAYELNQLTAVLRAGAHSYLLKTMTSEVLLKSLEIVMLGGTVFSSTVLPLIVGPHPQLHSVEPAPAGGALPDLLSGREKQILEGLSRGESNKAIARRLSITESTVKVHVKTILRKVKAQNRTQAAVWAMTYLTGSVSAAAAVFGLWDPAFLRYVSRLLTITASLM